jgi:transcription initiation factor TFIIF subunit beta
MAEHTSYVAAPDHEVQCTPRENEEWHRLQTRKETLARSGKKDTVLIDVNTAEILASGISNRNFLNPSQPSKPRPQDIRYQRLEESVLMDELAKCFQRFKYWHLRKLKEELKQPEAHLRDVLSKIAVLVKTGPAANTWTLRPEIAATLLGEEESANFDTSEGNDVKQEDIAPDSLGGDIDEDDDFDDDDEDMEDVQLPG